MSWTSCVEVLPEHRVCEQCHVILQFQAQVNEPSCDYGHKSVCLGCGVSVLRARSIPINRNRQEYTIIREWVPHIPVDLPIFTRVGRPCWRRATRAQVAIAEESTAEQELEWSLPNVDSEIVDAELSVHVNIGVQVSEDSLLPPAPPVPPPLPILVPEQEVARPQRPTLSLPNYKRVSSTLRQCIFSSCLNIERILRLIPVVIRQRILIDFNIYILRCARICSDHLLNNNWDSLESEHPDSLSPPAAFLDDILLNEE